MCGIVGTSMIDRLASREDVEAMNAAIVHRGPDGAGVLVDGRTALGMRRLSIIDLEGGWQPIANEKGDIHVVQNGEIYNYRELRQRLEQHGHHFRTNSDTETLVHAYEQWGIDFPQHLRGMFAFAIWDSRRQAVVIGRDRLGIKPLYYSLNSKGLLFASELSSIAACPWFEANIDVHGIQQFLLFGCTGFDNSFFQGVRQLPPGCTAEFRNGSLNERTYWSFRLPPKPSDRTPSRQQLIDALREHLRDAVRSHLVADVPVGAFLSGGIDSSAVVGLMAQEMGSDFQVFSIGFDEAQFDELEYAKRVARRWGLQHRFEIIRPQATDVLDSLLEHFGEPLAESSAIPMWYLSQLAARHVKVVLSGDGGDELFGGYSRYARALRHQWLDRVPRPVRQLGRYLGERLPSSVLGGKFLQYAACDRRGRYAVEMQLFSAFGKSRLLRPEWRAELTNCIDFTERFVSQMKIAGADDPLSELLYIDTLDYLPKHILTKVDRMTMAHSLESRPPLLDHNLVEFAATLPIEEKITRSGSLKHIFKEAVRPYVDDDILNRPKAGFAVPLDGWFAGPLATHFRDAVLDGGSCLEYLSEPAVREVFMENQSGRRPHGERLWAILQLEMWLRRIHCHSKFQPSTAIPISIGRTAT